MHRLQRGAAGHIGATRDERRATGPPGHGHRAGSQDGRAHRHRQPARSGRRPLVNAVAAYRRYGGPCIVVDFGTATTVDAIGADGAYLGGAIAPGLTTSAEALYRLAARLYSVELVAPRSVIGKNTVNSMQ